MCYAWKRSKQQLVQAAAISQSCAVDVQLHRSTFLEEYRSDNNISGAKNPGDPTKSSICQSPLRTMPQSPKSHNWTSIRRRLLTSWPTKTFCKKCASRRKIQCRICQGAHGRVKGLGGAGSLVARQDTDVWEGEQHSAAQAAWWRGKDERWARHGHVEGEQHSVAQAAWWRGKGERWARRGRVEGEQHSVAQAVRWRGKGERWARHGRVEGEQHSAGASGE